MLILWFIIYLLSHQAHPDHTALVIQQWENHHQFLTILILLFLA